MSDALLQPRSAPAPTGSGYTFVLPNFQGPLDLLLHLIRINELDIMDLPVAEVARQYDEMLDLMHELNLEVAGDFLVMAATLVFIKSRLVLPQEQERIQEGLEEDPRKDLVRVLLEHQRYQEAARELAEREQAAALVFARAGTSEDAETDGYLEVSLFDLLKAFRRMLEGAEARAQLTRHRDEIPLSQRIDELLARLAEADFLPFSRLLDDRSGLEALVVTFLALLELARMGSIRVYQREPYGEIRIRRIAA